MCSLVSAAIFQNVAVLGDSSSATVTVREDPVGSRVMLLFPGKPSAHVLAILKECGFKWSKKRGGWMRVLNNAGRAAVEDVIAKIT